MANLGLIPKHYLTPQNPQGMIREQRREPRVSPEQHGVRPPKQKQTEKDNLREENKYISSLHNH